MPKRIQRQRTKGWRMPEGAIYVGRPSRGGNPYIEGQESLSSPRWRYALDETVGLYRLAVGRRLSTEPDWLAPLRGHDLACWCPLDQPCHADVLLELADA